MRDEFSDETKRTLSLRVAGKCSRPTCRAQTSGPQVDPAGILNVGVASHITAASPDGPRYDPELTPDERRHLNNGIWLCQNCGKLVDNDPIAYPVGLLRKWKQEAENAAGEAIGRTDHSPTLLKEFRTLRDALVGPLHTRTPAMAEQLRREIEEANPNLRVTITYEENKRTYAFRFKDGITSTNAGTLTFPATDAGRRGSAKFTRVQDYGTTETLEPGEFTFAPTIRVPDIDTADATGHLTVGPAKPLRSFPVRIDATTNGQHDTLIGLTTLTITRPGRKEATVELAGGLLAGTLTITLTFDGTGRDHRTTLALDLGSLPARIARQTILLVQAMARGDPFAIVPLDSMNPSLTALDADMACPSDAFDDAADFLEWLSTISDEYKKDLRYPDEPDERTIEDAWTLATAITEGTVVLAPATGFDATIRGDAVALARVAWAKNERFLAQHVETETMPFLGHEFDLGRVLYKCYDVQRSAATREDDSTENEQRVTIGYIRKVFERWHGRSPSAPGKSD